MASGYGGYQQYGGNPYEQSGGGSSGNPYDQPSSNPYGQTGTASQYGQEASSNPYGQAATSNPYGQAATSNPYGQTNASSAGVSGAAFEDRREDAYYMGEPSHGVDQHTHLHNATSATSAYDANTTPGATNAQSQRQAANAQNVGGAIAPAPDHATMAATGMASPPSTILSNQDFLQRVEAVRTSIRTLTTNVSEIGMLHQRALSSPESGQSALDNLVSQTQILNTTIKDQIKYLETDAAKSGKNTTKDSQIRTLKGQFRTQLEDYQREEQTYRKRYQEQIAREYRIVNPNASEAEVQEASTADWGNEGVFQTALKSNRTAAASSTLGNVRARHNDIQQISKTLIELNQLFEELATQVILQEPAVAVAEEQTGGVLQDTEKGNKQLDTGIKHAKSRRKLKWICLAIVLLIIIILGLVLGLVFGLRKKNGNPLPV